MSWCSGSMGAMTGAMQAMTTRARMTTVPMMTLGLRRMRFSVRLVGVARALGIADPRVQERVTEVDEQVHEREDGGQHQHGALHHYQLAGPDGGDDERAHPRPREHGLHHDGATQQGAEL